MLTASNIATATSVSPSPAPTNGDPAVEQFVTEARERLSPQAPTSPNTSESLTKNNPTGSQFSSLTINPSATGSELVLSGSAGNTVRIETNTPINDASLQAIKDAFQNSRETSDAIKAVLNELAPSKSIASLEIKGCEVSQVGFAGMSLESFSATGCSFKDCSFTMMKSGAGTLDHVTFDSCTMHNFDASEKTSVNGVSFRNTRIDTIALPQGTTSAQVEARFRDMNLVGSDFSKQAWFTEQVAAVADNPRELKKIFSKSLVDVRSTTFSDDSTVRQAVAVGITGAGTKQLAPVAPAAPYSSEDLLSDLKLSAAIPTLSGPSNNPDLKEVTVVSASKEVGTVSVVPPADPSGAPMISLFAEGRTAPLVNTAHASEAAEQIFQWAISGTVPQSNVGQTPTQEAQSIIRIAPHFEEVRFKETFVASLPSAEVEKIAEIVEEMEHNGAVPAGSMEKLSPEAQKSLQEFQELFALYKGSFPDPTETEEAAALWEYMTSPDYEWESTVIKNDEGKTVAFSQGQVVDVYLPHSGESIRVGWVEHTAVHADYRREGLGSLVVDAQKNGHFKSQNAALALVEIDNPYAIADEPAAFNHADPEARGQFWANEGMAMDPFNRIPFWSSQDAGMLVMTKQGTGEVMPVPYIQIAMDESSEPCATLALSAIPLTDEMTQTLQGPGMHPADFVAIYGTLQGTIDEGFADRNSFKTALEDMNSFAGNVTLHRYADPESRTMSPAAMDVMERGAETRLMPVMGDFPIVPTVAVDPSVTYFKKNPADIPLNGLVISEGSTEVTIDRCLAMPHFGNHIGTEPATTEVKGIYQTSVKEGTGVLTASGQPFVPEYPYSMTSQVMQNLKSSAAANQQRDPDRAAEQESNVQLGTVINKAFQAGLIYTEGFNLDVQPLRGTASRDPQDYKALATLVPNAHTAVEQSPEIDKAFEAGVTLANYYYVLKDGKAHYSQGNNPQTSTSDYPANADWKADHGAAYDQHQTALVESVTKLLKKMDPNSLEQSKDLNYMMYHIEVLPPDQQLVDLARLMVQKQEIVGLEMLRAYAAVEGPERLQVLQQDDVVGPALAFNRELAGAQSRLDGKPSVYQDIANRPV